MTKIESENSEMCYSSLMSENHFFPSHFVRKFHWLMAESLAFDLGLSVQWFEETSLGVGSIFKYGKLIILHQKDSTARLASNHGAFFVNASHFCKSFNEPTFVTDVTTIRQRRSKRRLFWRPQSFLSITEEIYRKNQTTIFSEQKV